jgi:hypothetical protein
MGILAHENRNTAGRVFTAKDGRAAWLAGKESKRDHGRAGKSDKTVS